jgi:hypothetical protein
MQKIATRTDIKGLALGFMLVSTNVLASGPSWDHNNKPDWFNNQFNKLEIKTKLGDLKLSGVQKDHLPYSDSYWPLNLGGIAYRWYVPRTAEDKAKRTEFESLAPALKKELAADSWNYKLYTKEELEKLPAAALEVLSPAEKYDIYEGNFGYPTVRDVRKRSPKDSEYWEGICNGWSAAALNHAEPAPVTLPSLAKASKGAKQIIVPFGSADVKALLAWMYQKSFTDDWWQRVFKKKVVERSFVGDLCRSELLDMSEAEANDIAACADTNPAAFHIVIGNQMGREGRGFLMDFDRGHEIWNQPVFGYDSKIVGEQGPSRNATKGTVSEVIVETDLYFADDTFDGVAYWEPSVGTDWYSYDAAHYKYSLELDIDGKIIGGKWLERELPELAWLDKLNRNHPKVKAMKSYAVPPTLAQYRRLYDRPDDLWLNRKVEFKGKFEALGQIYKEALPGNIPFKEVKTALEQEYEEWMEEMPEVFLQ